jgi:hypothetical protein
MNSINTRGHIYIVCKLFIIAAALMSCLVLLPFLLLESYIKGGFKEVRKRSGVLYRMGKSLLRRK